MNEHTCQVFCSDAWHLFTAANGVTWCIAANGAHRGPCKGCAATDNDPKGLMPSEVPYTFKVTADRLRRTEATP